MADSPGLNEITTTTLRSSDMNDKDEKVEAKAEAGTPVAETDFSKAYRDELATSIPGKPPLPYTGKQPHGFGHPSSARDGKLRTSGHSGAHQIGKKK